MAADEKSTNRLVSGLHGKTQIQKRYLAISSKIARTVPHFLSGTSSEGTDSPENREIGLAGFELR